MDSDLFVKVCRQLQRCEERLGEPCSPMAARDELRMTLEQLRTIVDQLRQRESTIFTVLDTIDAFVIVLDVEGRVIRMNRSCEEIGYPPALVRGQYLWTLMPNAQDADAVKRMVDQALRGTLPPDYETRWTAPDGRRRVASWSTSVAREGETPRYVILSGSDVTERKKAEDALRLSQDTYRDLVENINDIIFEADASGLVTYISPAVESWSGYRPAEIIGRGFTEFIHPDDCLAARDSFERTIAGSLEPLEYRVIIRGGETRWVRSSSRPILRAGRAVGLRGVILDVTHSKQAEEAVQDERNFVTAVLDTVGALVGVVDRDGRIVRFNRTCEQILGYSMAQAVGRHFWDLLPIPEEVEPAKIVFRKLLAGEWPRQYETYWFTRAGERRDLMWSTTFLYDATGAIEYVVGTGVDITEQLRAKESLREQDARFRALTEYSSDAVALVSAEGKFLYVGPSVRRVLGYDPEELVGLDGLTFFHPDDRAGNASILADLAKTPGKSVTLQYRFRHKSGAWQWMEGIGANLLAEPAVQAIIFNARDITARMEAEALLRQSEERFALAVAGANDGLSDWNLDASEVYASPRLRAILDIADGVGVTPALLDGLVHPDDAGHVASHWFAHLMSDREFYEFEYRSRLRDGNYRWVHARGLTVRNADGRVVRAVGSLTDITQRKQAEDAARQREAELAHVLRVSAMGELASGLAHEINQPLSAIVNYARGCARRLQQWEGAPRSILQALERIADEALRAGGIVRGLRQFLRKEPGRPESEDLNVLVSDAIALVAPEARQHGIAIKLGLGAGMPSVKVDRVQIVQVIVNLIRNALEATESSGAVDCELFVRTSMADDESLTVAVSDSGVGLPAEIADKIFDPFYTTKATGLGMGLSISRSIVLAHGGRIWATPNSAGGTTFFFTIPKENGGGE